MRVLAAACRQVEGERSDGWLEFEQHVVSAFGEAFNNVVMHAYPNGEGELTIELDPRCDGITIRVIDQGIGFDAAEVAPPDLDALPTSGLGLYIMRSFMDDFAYLPGAGRTPNVLTLAKRLRRDGDERTAA